MNAWELQHGLGVARRCTTDPERHARMARLQVAAELYAQVMEAVVPPTAQPAAYNLFVQHLAQVVGVLVGGTEPLDPLPPEQQAQLEHLFETTRLAQRMPALAQDS